MPEFHICAELNPSENVLKDLDLFYLSMETLLQALLEKSPDHYKFTPVHYQCS